MENLSYLAFKLFGQADDYSMYNVSWAQFNRVRHLVSVLISNEYSKSDNRISAV